MRMTNWAMSALHPYFCKSHLAFTYFIFLCFCIKYNSATLTAKCAESWFVPTFSCSRQRPGPKEVKQPPKLAISWWRSLGCYNLFWSLITWPLPLGWHLLHWQSHQEIMVQRRIQIQRGIWIQRGIPDLFSSFFLLPLLPLPPPSPFFTWVKTYSKVNSLPWLQR